MNTPAFARIAPDHQPAVNAMILCSKAHWGYDAAMMAVMSRVLRLDPDAATQGRAVAAWADGEPVGMAQIGEPFADDRDAALELELLFISPEAIGTGLGRRLYHWAMDQARAAGANRLDILSDPYARPFYIAMGAAHTADRASTVIPGRMLPFFQHWLG